MDDRLGLSCALSLKVSGKLLAFLPCVCDIDVQNLPDVLETF
jgi:hypothetical protein